MKKITLLFFAMFAFAWQANAQTSTLYFSMIDNGCCDTEKWVSITTGPDNTGTVIYAQGNGTYGDGAVIITDAMFTVDDGTTYYLNAYDRYDDSWDGDTYEIRSAAGGGGILVANNGGVSPDDGNDDDTTSAWGDTQEQELEVSEAFSFTPPTCTTAVVNSATVMPDCSNAQFSVDVDVATVGDGANVTDGLGGTFPVVSGIVTAGPYATGVTVTLTLEHTDAACDFSLGDFSYDDCPTQVICGTPTNATGCYDNSSNLDWLFASSDGTSALKITVNSGTVENTYDEFIVYDGVDATAPELYNGYGTVGDLTGLTFNSTGTSLFVRIASDGSNSCGSAQQTSIDFNVECLSCSPATVTATVVDDCATSGGFKIEVDVTDLGSATSMTASDDQASASQTLNAAGMLTFGPYTNGTVVVITVANDQDAVCSSSFNGLVQDACPPGNDECGAATALTVNADYACGVVTSGTVAGATNSGVDVCNGTEDDDVWYSFVATSTEHRVSLINVAGSNTDMYHAVYDATPGCGALSTSVICNDGNTSNLTGLTIGNTYLVQVYTWTATAGQTTTFDICVGSPPTCPVPTGGSATAITETSADLSWTEAGTATMWNIELVDVAGGGTVTGNATASGVTNPYTATGLVGDNSYAFYVQADCGGGDTSAWSGPYTFATPYVAVIPSCTSGVFLDSGGAGSDYSSNEDVTYVIAPDVAGDAVTVTFTAFSSENNGATGCWDGLTVYNGPDATAATIDPPGGGTIWCWDRDDTTNQGTGDLQGMSITSTHASGTLTFVFTSDSSATREGWEATVTCSTLSTQSFDNDLAFTYYPNPVNENLVLKAQKDIENIAVYNMLGQEVLRTAPNAMNTEVNMSNLQTGAYFVKVTIGNTTETVRVIKN